GYVLGCYGRRAVPTEQSRMWRLAERSFRRWGLLALFVRAIVPNPVFDAVGILSGCLRYPVGRFWLATVAGKILKLCAFAYGGRVFSLFMVLRSRRERSPRAPL